MSSGKVPFHIAIDAAGAFLANISHCCQVQDVAGSIRRIHSQYGSIEAVPPETMVGDVEIIVIPKIEEREVIRAGTFNLFGQDTPRKYVTVNLVWERLDALSQGDNTPYGPYVKINRNGAPDRKWGDTYRRVAIPHERTRQLIPCDLFSATRQNYGIISMIRTGPASYSEALVSLRKPEIQFRAGELWIRGKSVPVPNEEALCDLLNIEWMPPHAREAADLWRMKGWSV